jgi:hypothetical protein
MLRQGVEPDAARRRGIVDSDQDSEPVHFTPCVLVLWKFPDKSNGSVVFNPPPVRSRYPVSEHPGFSFLAAYFLK